jgi:hypothetical protein
VMRRLPVPSKKPQKNILETTLAVVLCLRGLRSIGRDSWRPLRRLGGLWKRALAGPHRRLMQQRLQAMG